MQPSTGDHVLWLTSGILPGVACALGAAVLFAFVTVALRSPLCLPPLTSTAWQVSLGCLTIVAAGVLEVPDPAALTLNRLSGDGLHDRRPDGRLLHVLVAALRRLPLAKASLKTLLTPVVGVVAARSPWASCGRCWRWP